MPNSLVFNALTNVTFHAGSTTAWRLPGVPVDNAYSFSVAATEAEGIASVALTPAGWNNGPVFWVANPNAGPVTCSIVALVVFGSEGSEIAPLEAVITE